jgi:hypothetical protein
MSPIVLQPGSVRTSLSTEESNTVPFPQKAHADPNQVDWGKNDPESPRGWSTGYKAIITFQLRMLPMSASLGSSIVAPAEDAIANYIDLSTETSVLSVSLYVLGFAVAQWFGLPYRRSGVDGSASFHQFFVLVFALSAVHLA